MDGHTGASALDRTPPTGRLTVTYPPENPGQAPLTWDFTVSVNVRDIPPVTLLDSISEDFLRTLRTD